MNGSRSPHDQTDHPQNARKKWALWAAIAITSFTFLFQIAGAMYTGSLSLLGDTAHLFTDLFSLAVSLGAVILASRPANHHRSFGFYRLEVLAAFLNGILLVLVSLGLSFEAVHRLLEPKPVLALPLMGISAIGMICNLLAAWVLSRAMVLHTHLGHDHDHSNGGHACGHDHGPAAVSEHQHGADRNIQGAMLHVLSDALGSLAVVVGAVVIYFTDWRWVDPVLAFLLSLMILRWSVRLLADSGHVLLEGTPRHLKIAEITEAFRLIDSRVIAVEDLHVWEITSRMYACTAEVKVAGITMEEADALRLRLHDLAREKFGINHAVLEFKL
jgi:cobalt-zinc-cadmium efflux system protein